MKQQTKPDDTGRLLRDGIVKIRNEQVRQVQWALMRREPRAKRLSMMETLHRPWIDKLRAEHNWPVDAMVEMLFLTEGDEEEVDTQMAKWAAQSNFMGPGRRDHQQFISILHAQHQLRLHPISSRAQDDIDRETVNERYGKLSPEGRLVARAPASQVEAVQQRLLASTHAERLADLVRKTGLGPAIIVEAYQAVAPYKDPSARLLSLWQSWVGSIDNFPAYVRNEVRKHLGGAQP